MKIVRVDVLGDVCAFKPDAIHVGAMVYDKVPESEIKNFEAVLNKARDAYQAKVAEVKAKGERPKASQIKAEVIQAIVVPFLTSFGIDKKKANKPKVDRVVTSESPRITDAKDKLEVEITEVQKQTAEEFYDNNFSDELLDDSVEPAEGTVVIGDSADSFDMEDDFNFEGL